MAFPFGGSQGTNQDNAYYQQLLQRYQQGMATSQQQNVTTFINVGSEEEARRYDVPPNSSRNFINVNEGILYKKTVGMSILEPYAFERYHILRDDIPIQEEKKEEIPQVDMNSYMTKEDFEPYKEIINEMKSVVEELKG